MLCYIIDSMGRVSDQREIIDAKDIDLITCVPEKEHPLPHRARLCRWNAKKKQWSVEAKEAKAFDQLRVAAFRQEKIAECKSVCAELIESFCPLYKQVNLARENTKHSHFGIIDSLRELSNELEATLLTMESVEDIRTFDVRRYFKLDKRSQDQNGKFVGDDSPTP